MKKILVFQNLTTQQQDRIQKEAPGWEVICSKDKEIWEQHLTDSEIWIGWHPEAGEALVSGQASPRWVQLWSAGVNRFPLEMLKDGRMTLTNASGVHAYPISETVFAMMLAWTRRLHTYVRRQLESKWYNKDGYLEEMHEKTIGIVGVGAIGSEVARLAKAFRMTVLGMRRSGGKHPEVDRMYTFSEMEDMLSECDYVVNTLPLTAETDRMFGRKQFEAMKDSAFFVNIGRGQTVDTGALVEALSEGMIGGAGLDVTDPEPLPADHPLWSMDNVLITPHTSGSTPYYADRVLDIFIPNLQRYVSGGKPAINVVDPAHGY